VHCGRSCAELVQPAGDAPGRLLAQARELVAELKRRRSGAQLLAYREAGRWVELDAEEVNDYLKRHMAGDFSAKDFRTWNATELSGRRRGQRRASLRPLSVAIGV
jgi:DNA topoisomerase IB